MPVTQFYEAVLGLKKQNNTHKTTTVQDPGKGLEGFFRLELATEILSDIYLSASMATLPEVLFKNMTQQLLQQQNTEEKLKSWNKIDGTLLNHLCCQPEVIHFCELVRLILI